MTNQSPQASTARTQDMLHGQMWLVELGVANRTGGAVGIQTHMNQLLLDNTENQEISPSASRPTNVSPLPPVMTEIGKVRQLLITLSEYCSVFEDVVIFPWPVVHDEFTLLCPSLYVLGVAHAAVKKVTETKERSFTEILLTGTSTTACGDWVVTVDWRPALPSSVCGNDGHVGSNTGDEHVRNPFLESADVIESGEREFGHFVRAHLWRALHAWLAHPIEVCHGIGLFHIGHGYFVRSNTKRMLDIIVQPLTITSTTVMRTAPTRPGHHVLSVEWAITCLGGYPVMECKNTSV